MNRAFSARDLTLHESLGRCPRLIMKAAPLALSRYGRSVSRKGNFQIAPTAVWRAALLDFGPLGEPSLPVEKVPELFCDDFERETPRGDGLHVGDAFLLMRSVSEQVQRSLSDIVDG